MLDPSTRLCSSIALLLGVVAGGMIVKQSPAETPVAKSVFYTAAMARQAADNARKFAWAADAQKQIVGQARPWLEMSDERLWDLMFGNTIKRAWQVWSNGYCPVCHKPVPMYNWVINPFDVLWKVRCPHCKELFPKNDFAAYYRSGLDSHGIFDPRRADRSLLFNTEHPDAHDPLHTFGVDDGEGCVEGDHRWRFIGAYLIYGQWKQAVLGGITRLSDAYAVTGDRVYAHKAGVLLDRVADLYPSHDFGKQGVMYEGAPRSGYVSTWHDACMETRQMALDYDVVRDAIAEDAPLAAFLSRQAERYAISAPKRTCGDVMRNIEAGLLIHPLNHRDRIYCNYPQTEMTVAIIESILGGPDGDREALRTLDAVLAKATAVDGVTGEKGLTGYSVFATHQIATVLALYARSRPDAFRSLVSRHPRLRAMFRFHLDTLCCGRFYPRIGDCGTFAAPSPGYVGVTFSAAPAVMPSLFTFFWRLYEETRDPAFVQILYHANGDKTDGLPYELSAENPEAFQKQVRAVLAAAGTAPRIGSVNKSEWHLAILRSGEGADARALWLDYDSGGYHAHRDGMNIGLFAKGLDLLPDFGYPPVQFGGWDSPRAVWYTMTAAHNTVTVDGKNQRSLAGPITERAGYEGLPAGRATIWAPGKTVQAVRAECPEMIQGQRYDRTVAMADVSSRDFYAIDIFHVAGGHDHAKFLRGPFATLSTSGLALAPSPDYGFKTQMRAFRSDPEPRPGWSADWKVEDRYRLAPKSADVHLRYTDLTRGAAASTAESWVSPGGFVAEEDAWIPTLMVRRSSASRELRSTFVGVLEPYDRSPTIVQASRLPLEGAAGAPLPDAYAAVEVRLRDGRRDLWIAGDPPSAAAGAAAQAGGAGAAHRAGSIGYARGRTTSTRGAHLAGEAGRPSRRPDGDPAAHIAAETEIDAAMPAAGRIAQKGWRAEVEGELAFIRRSATGAVERVLLCNGRRLRVGGFALELGRPVAWIEVEMSPAGAVVLSGPADAIARITIDGKSVFKARKR